MSGSSQIHDLECQRLDVISLFLQGSTFFCQNSCVGAWGTRHFSSFSILFHKFEVLWGVCCVFSWGKIHFGFKRSHHNQYHLLYHQVLFCFGLFGLFSYQCSKNQYRHPCSAYLFKVPESNPGVSAFLKLKSLMYQVKPCMSALKSKISETRL